MGDTTMRQITAFLNDERAATVIDYSAIVAGFVVVLVPIITGMGSQLKAAFTSAFK
jgi:Flp pilus assembly pilin Flp